MIRSIRSRTTFANVTSLVALFVALGGSSYAALNLPKGSVGAKQLRRDAVTSIKVKRGSLLLSDFRASQRSQLRGARGVPGPQGPRGVQGMQGETGAPATKLFAYVNSEGTIAFHSGVTGIAPHTPGSGAYELTFNRSLAHCAVLTTSGRGFPSSAANVTQGTAGATPLVRESSPSKVQVTTFDPNNASADRGFFVTAFC